MNYSKIYQDFIVSRREREASIVGYSEKHHILPRALGGDNSASNMIRLIPEDHFFAHLLLAKIHGGVMCVAVLAMANLSNTRTLRDRCQLKMRVRFAHVRLMLARHYRRMFSGQDGPQADKTKHELIHIDGRKALGNRFELSSQTGLTRQQISAVLRGGKITAHGWFSRNHNPAGKTRSQLISDKLKSNDVYNLYHYNGDVWAGTMSEFSKKFGKKLWFQKNSAHVAGWYKTEIEAQNHHNRLRSIRIHNSALRGDISGCSNPNSDKTEYKIICIETNRIAIGTRSHIAAFFGVSRRDVAAIVTGAQKTSKGLRLC